MQRRLLSEKGLSYRKAMDVALAMEAAERETKALKPAASTIHKFASQDSRRKERSSCYRCGRSNHGPADCRFRETDCRNCGKKGHIAPVCRSKRRTTSPTQPKSQRSRNRKQFRSTHQVQEVAMMSTSDASGDEYFLHKVGERSSAPIEVDVTANGRKLTIGGGYQGGSLHHFPGDQGVGVSRPPTAQLKGDLESIHRGAYASNRQFACEGTVRHSSGQASVGGRSG